MTPSGGPGGGERLPVVASMYPVQYLVEQIGGDRVRVTTLTKPGVEAHDLELTPRDVGTVAQARLTAYIGGLQPAVDRTVTDQGGDRGLDLAPVADLTEPGDASTGGDHVADPHFWLDPTRYAKAGGLVADRLAALDPGHAQAYRDRAKRFAESMALLDAEFAAGLKTCTSRNLVTAHTAFAYLADRYRLTEVGITGVNPEAEPTPAQLARVADQVRKAGGRTVYAEVAGSRAVAETVAREAGAQVAVLDPIEGISNTSAGTDYPAVMRANLATLRTGQGCR